MATVVLGLALELVLGVGLAQAVTLDIPDSLSGGIGDTVDVPILVSGQTGRNIIAADITLRFGESVLTATPAYRVGSAAQGWMAFVNPVPCSLLVAMASASPLVAGDTLLVVRMYVDTPPDLPDTTTIWFSRCRLNEGQVPCTTQAGKFYGYTVGVEDGRTSSASRHSPFAVSPNPVSAGGATVSLATGHDPNVRRLGSCPKLVICDAAGNVVRTLGLGRGAARLDARGLSDGVYFARLTGTESSVVKVIIAR